MSCARQHTIFSSDPTLSLAFQKARNTLFNGGGTKYFSIAELDQHGAFCVFGVITGQGDWAHLIGATT
ncbi:hypothetical protein D3C75_764440 [compost metagenome]